MSRFKLEKGISRIKRVKLQASIEDSIAADLTLMSEWSNNDKNYVVNELLRFALFQDAEFQKFKASRTGVQQTQAAVETNSKKDANR